MKGEIPKKGGEEWDCFTGWRKMLCYMKRPGVTKSIKRKYNKRLRKKKLEEIEYERDCLGL